MAATLEDIAPHNRGNAEIRVRIKETQGRRNFDFIVYSDHIEVQPKTPDWYEVLKPEERLLVFNRILGEVRLWARAANDYKFAAIGMTPNHTLFINTNTEVTPHDYKRLCAEQNIVSSAARARERDKRLMTRRGGTWSEEQENQPLIQELYLMGGPKEGKAMCPCGECTDLLAKVMPKDGKVWVLPVNDGKAPLVMKNDIEMLSQHNPGLDPGEVWQTTIGHLNQHRMIKLPPQQADMQRKAFDRVIQAISRQLNDPTYVSVWQQGVLPDIDQSPQIGASALKLPHVLNRQMVERLEALLTRRVKRLIGIYGISDTSATGVRQFILNHVQYVRCNVVELDSGKVFSHASSRDDSVGAAPHTEVITRDIALEHAQEEGICRSIVMELNPRAIEAGELHTSPKEAAERHDKAHSWESDTVRHEFIIYNDGKLTDEQVRVATVHKGQHELSPGGYRGRHTTEPKGKGGLGLKEPPTKQGTLGI